MDIKPVYFNFNIKKFNGLLGRSKRICLNKNGLVMNSSVSSSIQNCLNEFR